MEKIKHKKQHLKKASHHLKTHHHENNNPKSEAQEQHKNNIKLFFKVTLITLVIIIFLRIIAGKNKTTAEILIDEFVAALKSQLGFDYNADPLSDYVFSKNTPNYNAYAADKKLSGIHRMLLERDGIKMEIKFKSAEVSSQIQNQTNPDLAAVESTTGAAVKSNPIQSTIDELNSQLEEISTGLEDISQKISDIQQDVSEISSKAKMVPENNERKILYQDIVYGTDIIYGLGEEGIKQEIILKNKENLNNIFNFSLNIPDMSYKDVGRGVWYFSNKENKIMRIPKAYAIDSNGKFTNEVDIRVKTTLLVTIMTVNVPLDWLQDKDRAYPVKVWTAFEIVPSLRDGTSKPIDSAKPIDATNPITNQISPITESSNSAVLNASDSAIINATESSKVEP